MQNLQETLSIVLPIQAYFLFCIVVYLVVVPRLRNFTDGKGLLHRVIYLTVEFGFPVLGFWGMYRLWLFFAKRPWWIW